MKTDDIEGKYSTLKNKIMWFNYYRKAYKNFLNVIKKDLNKNYPFEATLRNGKKVSITSRDKAALFALLSAYKSITYYDNDDSISFNYRSKTGEKKLRLFGISQNLDAILVFNKDEETYKNLPLQNKIIIDIGACTGDTAIYFALQGAAKIIALEPFPKNYQMAIKNVDENNLNNKIKMVLGGCGLCSKTIMVDPNYQSSMRSSLREFATGTNIPIFTLEQILEDHKIDDAILKMDCEGCEYETILNAAKDTLLKFSHIQIEYHNGYENLKKKLVDCGFRVTKLFADTAKRGHILATRNRSQI
jgi:FkbM family methyltransferase